MKENKKRQMIKILKEICFENGICFQSFSQKEVAYKLLSALEKSNELGS